MTDFLSPQKSYDAAQYVRDATAAIQHILKKKKIPIVVGGSGFYFQALEYGMFPQIQNKEIARKIAKLNHQEKLEKLRQLDPQALNPAAPHHIHSNDLYRIERALSISWGSQRKILWSDLWEKKQKQAPKSPFQFKKYTLPLPDDYQLRIKERILKMIDQGLFYEVQKSFENYQESHGFLTAGFNIVLLYLQKKIMLFEFIERFARFHYQIARKQRKWFARTPHLHQIGEDALIALLNEQSKNIHSYKYCNSPAIQSLK